MRYRVEMFRSSHATGRGDIENHAPASGNQVRPDIFGGKEDDIEFIAQGVVPLCRAHLRKGRKEDTGGIVVQNIDATIGPRRALNPCLTLLIISDIYR